jgi:hypothetical protein
MKNDITRITKPLALADLAMARQRGLKVFLITLRLPTGQTIGPNPAFAKTREEMVKSVELLMDHFLVTEATIEPCLELTEESHASR